MATEFRFKHLQPQQVKENWQGIKPSTQTSDSSLIKGNSKFIGFSYYSQGGGLLCILDQKRRGKMPIDIPMIKGHSKAIQDFEFFPFNENYVATCSEDALIKVWKIPDDFTSSITECQLTIQGHQKKVNLLSFNQGSEGVLAASDYEYKIKIWDLMKSQDMLTLKGPQQYAQCIDWNSNGSILGSCWKDKCIRFADPRTQNFTQQFVGHEGGISIKFCWLKREDQIVSFGFSKDHEREYKLWDLNNTTKPLITQKIDNASGVFCPYFDQDLQILYVSGKGDGNIRYYEYQNSTLTNFNNEFKSNQPGKGYGYLPKYALDASKNEIMRVLKLTENSVETISFICPRKAIQFQEDLFPPCCMQAGQTADQYFAGKNCEPLRTSLKPGETRPALFKNLTFVAGGAPSPNKVQKLDQEEFKQIVQEPKLEAQTSNKEAPAENKEHQIAQKQEQNQQSQQQGQQKNVDNIVTQQKQVETQQNQQKKVEVQQQVQSKPKEITEVQQQQTVQQQQPQANQQQQQKEELNQLNNKLMNQENRLQEQQQQIQEQIEKLAQLNQQLQVKDKEIEQLKQTYNNKQEQQEETIKQQLQTIENLKIQIESKNLTVTQQGNDQEMLIKFQKIRAEVEALKKIVEQLQ